MSQPDPQDTLSRIAQHLAVAQTYIGKVAVLVAEYQETIAPVPPGGSAVRSSNTAINSLQAWAEYLDQNGPTARGDLFKETGLNLTKSGYDRTMAWTSPMTYMQDDAFPADAVLRIKGSSASVGRPPVIYFLWNQRWSVRTLFGVGPIKPNNMPAHSLNATELRQIEEEEAGRSAEALTGVVRPPVSSHPIDPADGEEQPFDWPEPDPTRYATMVEWDDAWESQFDLYVATETKPTDEQKQTMWDTLPDGAERNAALAIAYRSAVGRSRANHSGVNWADAVDDIRSETDPT